MDHKIDTLHLEALDNIESKGGDPAYGRTALAEDANLATQDEHNTTFLQAIKHYPKACFWSVIVSLCIIMDGLVPIQLTEQAY